MRGDLCAVLQADDAPADATRGGALRHVADFYKAGKAKAIGVSNYCPSSFKCILETAKITPAVNQVEYHVTARRALEPRLKWSEGGRPALDLPPC